MSFRIFAAPTPQTTIGSTCIIDTDLSTDCDDVADLILAAEFHKLGLVEIRSVIVSDNGPTGAAAADAILYHCGITPLRRYASLGVGSGHAFVTQIASLCPHPHARSDMVAATPLAKYRSVLAEAADGSIKIVTLGALTRAAELMNSPADAIDSRTGMQLISDKVTDLVVVADNRTRAFGNSHEWNINLDPSAAADVCDNWPGQITNVFCDDADDVTGVGGVRGFNTSTCPMAIAYNLWLGGSAAVTGRPGWGLPSIEHIADTGYYTLEQGTWRVTLSSGQTAWTVDAGPHRRVVRTQSTTAMRDRWNAFLDGHEN